MNFSVSFVFLGLLSAAFAGVGILTPADEQEVLALWGKVCADQRSEGAQVGDTRVYCKNAREVLTDTVTHQVQVTNTPVVGDQVVFVRPAPVIYKHNVQIQGGVGAAQKTKIYVLPSKSEHSIKSEYIPGPAVTQKPNVYFLKSDGENGAAGYRYGNVPVGAAGFA